MNLTRRGFLGGLLMSAAASAVSAPAIVQVANIMPVKSFIDWQPLVGGNAARWLARQYGFVDIAEFNAYLVQNNVSRFEGAWMPSDHHVAKAFTEAQRASSIDSARRLGHPIEDVMKAYEDAAERDRFRTIYVERLAGTPFPEAWPEGRVVPDKRDADELQLELYKEGLKAHAPGRRPSVDPIAARAQVERIKQQNLLAA